MDISHYYFFCLHQTLSALLLLLHYIFYFYNQPHAHRHRLMLIISKNPNSTPPHTSYEKSSYDFCYWLSCCCQSIRLLWLRFTHSNILSCFLSGWILIDRSGKHFGSILCYLRDGTVSLPKGRQAVQELLAEAKYYLIQGLVELCQNSLQVSHIQQWKWPIACVYSSCLSQPFL